MIGLVLVTHARLGAEFLAAVEHVVGPQPQTRAVHVTADFDIEQSREEIFRAVRDVDSGQGVILLTDMFGGTPSNLAISTLDRANVEVLTGLNLPMLIKLTQVRKQASLREAAAAAQEAGRKYISAASELLATKDRA
jgi:PTS system mannose-specific IIA component